MYFKLVIDLFRFNFILIEMDLIFIITSRITSPKTSAKRKTEKEIQP